MDEQEKELFQVIKDFADRLLSMFDDFAKANMDNVNEYLREQTYRPSNLYITLNIAIISGTSILFSTTNGNIGTISKFLYLGVGFSFLSIILEIYNRKNYLHIFEVDSISRANNADLRRKELGSIMKDFQKNGPMVTFENLGKLPINLDEGNAEIQKNTTTNLVPVSRMRKYSQICMLIALLSLFGIGFSELEFPGAFFRN